MKNAVMGHWRDISKQKAAIWDSIAFYHHPLAYVVIKDFPLADFGNRIPNFTFEVRRTLKKPVDLEDKIKEISLIPGAGEFVYDTVVQEKQYGQQDIAGNFVQGGQINKLNLNNLSNKADVLVSLDNMKATLPNVEWVSIVLNWFADSVDPGVCNIRPASEFNSQGARVYPVDWSVAGYNRNNAHQILHFVDGSASGHSINALAANAAFSVPAGKNVIAWAATATKWIVNLSA